MSQTLYGSKLRFFAIKISTDDSASQDFEVLRKRMVLKENTVPCMIDKIKQVKDMSRIMEELIEEFIDDDKKESALLMLEDGKLSKEKIAEYLRLDIEVVEALEKEQKAVSAY